MRIAFVLPGNDNRPYGGYRIVYEHAARLTQRGHSISLIFPAVRGQASPTRRIAGSALTPLWRIGRQTRTEVTWFTLPDAVVLQRPARLTPGLLTGYDVAVATAWDTAEDVAGNLPAGVAGAYFLQHDETWSGPPERVIRTWQLPLSRLVIARWLEKLALERRSDSCFYVPNAVDEAFTVSVDPASREPATMAMVWHPLPWKGSDIGLAALELVRAEVPELKVNIFGHTHRPAQLPAWIRYHRQPSREQLGQLLNNSAVALAPSLREGFGLPPAEAMSCGVAVVAADNDGHREFADPDVNAVLVPAGDATALARRAVELIRDPATRIRLARAAGETMAARFSWLRSVDAMEAALLAISAPGTA